MESPLQERAAEAARRRAVVTSPSKGAFQGCSPEASLANLSPAGVWAKERGRAALGTPAGGEASHPSAPRSIQVLPAPNLDPPVKPSRGAPAFPPVACTSTPTWTHRQAGCGPALLAVGAELTTRLRQGSEDSVFQRLGSHSVAERTCQWERTQAQGSQGYLLASR